MNPHKFKHLIFDRVKQFAIYCEYCGETKLISDFDTEHPPSQKCPNSPEPIVNQLTELVQKLIDEVE